MALSLNIGEPSDEEKKMVSKFKKNFVYVACYQGTICYALQSIHIMNPYILNRILGFEPKKCLYWNVCYGTTFIIFNRTAMRKLTLPYRWLFSIFGSWMFSYTSVSALRYISENKCPRSTVGAVMLGYMAGRCMYSLLEAYLYFVDMSHHDIANHKNPTIVDFL